MIEGAMHVAYRNAFARTTTSSWRCKRRRTAVPRPLGLTDYGLAPGDLADIVVVPASCAAEAVRDHPPRRVFLKRGRVVSERMLDETTGGCRR